MKNEMNVQKEKLKAKRAKAAESNFQWSLYSNESTAFLRKSRKWSNLASVKMFEGEIWVIVLNGKAGNI